MNENKNDHIYPEKTRDIAKIIGGKKVRISNNEKIFWPGKGVTKGDLMDFYLEMAGYILPYLKDRPQELHRHPDGIQGKHFFQKNLHHLPPEWVKTHKIYSESKKRFSNYVIFWDRATLAYLVNLGCIEPNVWNLRIGSLDRPDYLAIGLDPENIDFVAVVEEVKKLYKILVGIGAPSFLKTSGQRGLHVYVPLGARHSHEQSQDFTRLVAMAVHQDLPRLTSLERNPKKRPGRNNVDYLQNGYGKTMVAPYSRRPKEGAPVSAPLGWEEIHERLDPCQHNIHTVFDRLAEKGDLWKNLFREGIDMEAALDKLGKYLKYDSDSGER